MNTNHRNVITKYWQFISLVSVVVLAVMLSAGHSLTQAQDPDRTLTIPLGSTGLTFGEGLRATLTNLGNRRVNAQIRILDSEGAVLKQEALVLEPNRMRAVALSRDEAGGREAIMLLRAEAVVTETDAPQLWLTGEVINSSTGSTQFLTTSGNGPLMGSQLNHNETLVRDQQ
ncbi:MAG: hypothetical protein ABI977_04495 [Acidobacteriota bacterium]